MRYYYTKPNEYKPVYGKTYQCDHLMYDSCTLYRIGDMGLAVVQKRFSDKTVYWTEIDPWLRNEIYLNENFRKVFDQYAGLPDSDGVYPTISVRKLMWALRMKPMKKEPWDSYFNQFL